MNKFSIYSYLGRKFTKNRQFPFTELFNKRLFLSLIVDEAAYTFVSSLKNRLKDKPMTALLKTSSTSKIAHRPLGFVRVLMLLAALVACLQGNAQGWEIYFGGNNDDQGQSILQTQDHGYVGVGSSESTGGGNGYQVYVIRTDVDGSEVWSNRYDDLAAQQSLLQRQLQEQTMLVTFLRAGRLDRLELATATGGLPESRAVLMYQPESPQALLYAEGFPPLSADQVYQLWLVQGETRISGGLFQVDANGYGLLYIDAPLGLGSYDRMGVTPEPAGGSPGPTAPAVVRGAFGS